MYARPTEPRSIGEVLDDGLKLWREAFPKTWMLAMLGRLVIALPSIFMVDMTIDAAQLNTMQKFSMMMGQTPKHLWIFYLLTLISYIFHTAVLVQVAGVAEARAISFSDSIKRGVALMPRLVLFYIFLILGGAVLGVAGAIPMAIIGAAVKAPLLTASLTVLIIGGAVLFLVVRVFLGYIALVVDDKPAWQSLQVSWNLTRGNWWRTTAIFTVVFIIALVLSAAMYLIGGVLVATWGMLSMVTIIGVQIVSVIVYALLGSLYPAMLYAAYQDLKLRRDGSDLVGRVNALAAQ